MSDFVLSTCSTADVTREFFRERNLEFLCFHFEIDGKTYRDDMFESMSADTFYQSMAKGSMTRTSQPNSGEYAEFFERFLYAGKDILHLSLSSGISGAYNSANIAAEMMREKYPDRKIYIVDSLCASSAVGLFMDKLAEMRDAGMSIDELHDWAEEHKYEMQHWFFTGDLTYLIRGGRVSKISGYVGQVLNICPLLNVNFEGKLITRQKIRTKRKVMQGLVDTMAKTVGTDPENYDGKVYISNAYDMEDAEATAALIEKRFPKTKGKITIFPIGTTIGSHTGPGLVAVFFWGEKRVD